MKVIGHRGAAGLALENTAESIEAAIKAGVDAIEFDIRVTKDQKIVLNHDKHLGRVATKQKTPKEGLLAKLFDKLSNKDETHIHEHSLRKLRTVPLDNDQPVATLREALQIAGDTPLVIEGKDSGWAVPLANFLLKTKHRSRHQVISFNHQELYEFHLLLPDVATYVLEHTSPFDAIRTARVLGFTGVDLNFWILSPLSYWLARRHRLDIIVYTVNKPLYARFLKLFYPHVSITTDVPNHMQFLRRHLGLGIRRPKNPKI